MRFPVAVGFVSILIAIGRFASAGETALAAANLYPYVVPDAYLQHGGRDLAKPLGHGMNVALVFDLGATVQSATAENLDDLGLSVDRAHRVALENLERLAEAGQVEMSLFPNGPGARPFVLVGGHWAAATSILLPDLARTAVLGTQDVCASIPHRDAMLIFGCGDRTYRDSMRALVREKESGGAKPLTYELFRIGQKGVSPLVE
jgi:hypothetical protein